MKMKNANFFQLHVEKLILGAAGLIALLIILVYAVGSPYTATVGNQELGPRKVEEYLQQQVQSLRARVGSEEPQFEPPQIAGYSQELAARLETDAAPVGNLGIGIGPGGLAGLEVSAPLTPYDLPRPPLPTEIKARASFTVLSPQEDPQQQQQLVQLVGQETPWDIRYVSVEAEWPLAEWRSRLESSQLPTSFWRSMVGITSVYLQREELNPETGEWGNPTIIQPLPGQLAAKPGEKGQYTDETATQLVRFMREQQAKVARPDFPAVAEGMVWLPPSSDFMNLDRDEQRRLAELRKDIASLEKRIENRRTAAEREAEAARRRAERAQRQPARQQARQNPGRNVGPEDFDPGMMEQGPRAMPQPTDRSQEAMQEMQRLQADLQQKRTELNELVGVPQDMLTDPTQMVDPYGMYGEFGMYGDPAMMSPDGMYDPYAAGAMGPGAPFGQMPGNPWGQPGVRPGMPVPPQPGVEEPASDDTIRVWAHDVTVEPGKTYRYRVLVSVFNPLFRQTRVEEGQRREFYDQVALAPAEQEIASSPWSEPVRVDPEYHFFFLRGQAGQVAEVEVWHVYNGQWHTGRFQVSPGDPIGGEAKIQVAGAEQELVMDTGAVMVDLVSSGTGMLGGDTRLLYIEPQSQAIASRSSRQDEDSADRIRLQNEREFQQQAITAAASAAAQ